MSEQVFYLVLYIFGLSVALVAAILKLISPEILVGALLFVFGHGAGVFTPPPGSVSVGNKPTGI